MAPYLSLIHISEFALSCMMELYDENRIFPDLIMATQNGVSPTCLLYTSIRVADKGLNCFENILHALKSGDGYIFSKSVKMLSETEKRCV